MDIDNMEQTITFMQDSATNIVETVIMGEEEATIANINNEESGRGCRNKKRQLDPTFCPVCSITLRTTDIDQHLACEIDKLSKISSKSKRNGTSPTTVNGAVHEIDNTWETYQKVKDNRQTRQRVKGRKRKPEEAICPVCNKETTENITLHVEKCLRESGEEGDESIDVEGDESIDVEGDENIDVEAGDVEEYEWAGQSRVRTTSMLEGGVSCLGTPITRSEEEDEDLVVDDTTQPYGESQYGETDIILSEAEGDDTELRKAVIGEDIEHIRIRRRKDRGFEDLGPDMDPVVTALKYRIEQLESRDCNNEIYKCLICMDRYKNPVTSTCCWHVYCEVCWLQTLGAKKLCPQCNMITSPSDLRRIYM